MIKLYKGHDIFLYEHNYLFSEARHEKEKIDRYDDEKHDRREYSENSGMRRHELHDIRTDETSDDENLPPAKQETKLKKRIRRVLDWL